MTLPQKSPSIDVPPHVPDYRLGHGDAELRRLMVQAEILRPITERLLREAGLHEGMRVLDLGCGPGDVTMLAADIVGPAGSVVGIDRSTDVIALAQHRAGSAGAANVEFKTSSVHDFDAPGAFDMAIGRYVLVHQADPVGFLRAAARSVRPGGVIAVHENTPPIPVRSYPPLDFYDRLGDMIAAVARFNLPCVDAALRAPKLFREAGLPHPAMFCETPVSDGEKSSVVAWTAGLHRTLRPQYERAGIAVPEEYDFERIEARLGSAARDSGALLFMPMQICFWARL